MKFSNLVLLGVMAVSLVGCGAIKNTIKAGMDAAKAEEEAGWKLDRNREDASSAAVKFLEQKTGVTPNSKTTGGGPFTDEVKVWDESKDGNIHWELYIFTPRLNGGTLPDSKSAQLHRVVYKEKVGGNWKDASKDVVEHFVTQYKNFLVKFNP